MKKSIKKMVVYTITGIALMALTIGCGGSKSSGYNAVQSKPVTPEQKQAANRGVKLEKEECEEKALEESKNLREVGSGISDKEAFAVNLALLDARAKMAQQLELLVNGMIRNFNQQHEADKGFASVAKATGIQQAYFEQLLTNTRTICKNTYAREDGKYNVFVCIELGDQTAKAIHKKLSDDKKIEIDFQEHQFLQDLEKAKEDYRKKKANE